MIEVSRHLHFCHNLPQGVLHRDVRPSNIMVPQYFWTDAAAEQAGSSRHAVVLLNYDMSWHTKATGQSITGNLAEAGFYPPEQIHSSNQGAARTTQVDSYGVGMCIYYLYTREVPPPGGSSAANWKTLLKSSFRKVPGQKWVSAPFRLARIIETATRPSSGTRLLISQIQSSLEALSAAVGGSWDNLTPDIWAEEVACRAFDTTYEEVGGSFRQELRSGRIVSVTGSLQENAVYVKFTSTVTETSHRSGVSKLWNEKLRQAKEILTSGSWEVTPNTRMTRGEMFLEAKITVRSLRSQLDKAVETLSRGLDLVRLD